MDPIDQNIRGVQQLVGSKINKSQYSGDAKIEGPTEEQEDALTLKLDDSELLRLARNWESKYRVYEAGIKQRQQANLTFYLGRQNEGSQYVTAEGQPIASNILFEAQETFLPAALSKNPEPVVWSDDTDAGTAISKAVKTMLQYHADVLVLRRKLTLMVRKWSVDLLGVVKHGWAKDMNDISCEVRDAKNFVFDVNGYVDPYGDFIGGLGERIKITADKLIALNPKHASFISLSVNGRLGTEVTYTQWWNDDYFFETYMGKVIDKGKNPFFNYDKTEKETDEDGVETDNVLKGVNHFASPKKPYTFLSVFSFGDKPHDETGLIEQNIPNQRKITRREVQIDYNLSRANNSDVFSEGNFTQETAKQAAKALALGHPVLIPKGTPISEAIHRLQAPGLDASFFKDLDTTKNDLRSIFGTQGITAMQPDEDQTARGMILNQQYDTTRIGGGIGDAIEQVADNIFNWWVQLYHVFYDVKHFAAVMGQMRATEYITLSRQDFESFGRQVVVSVAPNSMKPKDEVTEMNQALALWDKGAMDPKTLLTILNFPDPQATAENVVLWKIDPQSYMRLNFPDLMNKLQGLASQMAGAAQQQPAGGVAPEAVTEPPPAEGLSQVPPNPSLSQVELPK